MIAEILAAIEATEQSDWEEGPPERGFSFATAASQGWTIRIGFGQSAGEPMQDGTASRPPGTIVHLTPEHSRLARLKATGECCIRGLGLHNLLCPKEGRGGR